jgi:hypothetical protein
MITEKIDLTLNSLFSELHMPLEEREYSLVKSNRGIVFNHGREIAWDENIIIFANIFQNSHDYEEYMNSIINLYFDIFDSYPALENFQHDPLALYLFSCGLNCDACGINLNFFNRGPCVTLCQRCEYPDNDNFNLE